MDESIIPVKMDYINIVVNDIENFRDGIGNNFLGIWKRGEGVKCTVQELKTKLEEMNYKVCYFPDSENELSNFVVQRGNITSFTPIPVLSDNTLAKLSESDVAVISSRDYDNDVNGFECMIKFTQDYFFAVAGQNGEVVYPEDLFVIFVTDDGYKGDLFYLRNSVSWLLTLD